jgi:cytochrome c oxidase cbb3-type subunit II
MKSNFLFFAGLFAALLISWLGIVIGSNSQLGSLAPYYDDNDGSTHPEWLAGVAAEGQLVYRDLGCIACHTQQVRRPSFGSDQARGWGDRQSVARDYIYQPFPQLGLSRIGPDLTNVGDRKPPYDADDLLTLLYSGSGGGMPSYRFLFEKRQIGVNAQPSDNALKLTGALKPAAGWEIVPTRRAQALVGYLLNLKTTYTYPEAAPFVPPPPEGGAAKPAAPAAGPAPAPAPGAAAPAPSAAQASGAAKPAPSAGAPTASAPAAAPAGGAAPTPAPSASPGGATPAPSAAPASGSPTPAASGTGATPAAQPGTAPAPASGSPAPAASGSAPTPAAQPAATPASSSPAAPAPATTPAGGAPAPTPTAGTGGTK